MLTSNTDGRLPAGSQLPTEAELQEKLGISHSVDGEPIALIETWLPLPLAEPLTAAELTDASLHKALRRRSGIAIVSGCRQVRAVAAAPTVAEALGYRRSHPSCCSKARATKVPEPRSRSLEPGTVPTASSSTSTWCTTASPNSVDQ